MEMPGLWKAWKAKSRLPTLSTSPLEISPKGGVISTFPQLRRSGLEKWKTQKQVFHFPTAPSFSFRKKKTKETRGLRPPRAAALRARPKKSESNCR